MHFLSSPHECDSQDWPVIFGKQELIRIEPRPWGQQIKYEMRRRASKHAHLEALTVRITWPIIFPPKCFLFFDCTL